MGWGRANNDYDRSSGRRRSGFYTRPAGKRGPNVQIKRRTPTTEIILYIEYVFFRLLTKFYYANAR